MKKILLNESEKKAIISEREKAIIANFVKTFNTIKRVDENELNEIGESNDGIRLSKAAKSVNVGVSTLVDFLNANGVNVDMNPNFKLSSDQYDLIMFKFGDKLTIINKIYDILKRHNFSQFTDAYGLINAYHDNDAARQQILDLERQIKRTILDFKLSDEDKQIIARGYLGNETPEAVNAKMTNKDSYNSRTEKEKEADMDFMSNMFESQPLNNDGEDYEQASRGVEYGVDPYSEKPSLFDNVAKIYITRPEFNGSIMDMVYGIYIMYKDGKQEKIRSIDNFNQKFGTNIPSTRYPDDVVSYLETNHPEVSVYLDEFDVS